MMSRLLSILGQKTTSVEKYKEPLFNPFLWYVSGTRQDAFERTKHEALVKTIEGSLTKLMVPNVDEHIWVPHIDGLAGWNEQKPNPKLVYWYDDSNWCYQAVKEKLDYSSKTAFARSQNILAMNAASKMMTCINLDKVNLGCVSEIGYWYGAASENIWVLGYRWDKFGGENEENIEVEWDYMLPDGVYDYDSYIARGDLTLMLERSQYFE